MNIAINASAAFKEPRTGVEEYTYQLIRHLMMLPKTNQHYFHLYTHKNKHSFSDFFNARIPENFKINYLKWPLPMWTQARLSFEIFRNEPDLLFIPVHILPLNHPDNSVVTIHGLEYEHYPELYPAVHLKYLRWSTRRSLKKARKIIAISENSRRDLIDLYGANPNKIEVIYHGVAPINDFSEAEFEFSQKYLLYIGRIESKKNIQGLIMAFCLLKDKYQIPHKLILAGLNGYGASDIFKLARFQKYSQDIIFSGYLQSGRWGLYKNADAFILPSYYEGFGLPILEAQSAGCPVITSNVSSMPEIAGRGAVLVEPKNIEIIADGIYKVISDNNLKKDLIAKGYENIKRFSWEKCARETLAVLEQKA